MSFTAIIPAKKIVLSEATKPKSIIVDQNNLYVAETGSILIYSRANYHLLKKFGKNGSGPGEFPGQIQRIIPFQNDIWISSMNKLSIFTKEGTLKKEYKVIGGIFNSNLYPLGKSVVGTSMKTEKDGKMFFAINIFNQDQAHLNKGTVLIEYPFGSLQKMYVINAIYAFTFTVANNKVYAADKDGFKVHVFDQTGKELSTFEHPYKPVRFSEEMEKKARRGMKKSMPAGQYEAMKDRFVFPENLPAIIMLQASDNHIYGLSSTDKPDLSICYIMDLKGKLLDKKPVKFIMTEQAEAYPFFIYQQQLFQLVENEETEDWELTISSL
jgi:hypothetical protein